MYQLFNRHRTAQFCLTSCLHISFNMLSHHIHIWGSDKYFTPTAASLPFSSSLLFIIFALHMCQYDSPSVLVFVHLFPLHPSLPLSLSLCEARPLNALTCSGFRLSQACSSTLAHVFVCVSCVHVCVFKVTHFSLFYLCPSAK